MKNMAEKNFFDLLKDKMAALRPSEKHRDDDWGALGERLNAALPQQPKGRRRTIVLPLLLIAALMSSNAVWWHSSQCDQIARTRLEAQVIDLQKINSKLASTQETQPHKAIRDTLWRTVYIRSSEKRYEQSASSEKSGFTDSVQTVPGKTSNMISDDKIASDSILKTSDSTLAEHSSLSLIDTSKFKLDFPESLLEAEKKPVEPFADKLLDALRPKFFKVGVNIGWLYANSTGLMHEGGILYNLRGEIGLSRHWSVMANLGMGRLHYKAHSPEAILGAPDFPMLPSMEHHLTEMDVTGQKIHQFGLGLRYTFAQPGKPRPFLGIDWSGQTLMPFTIEYEIQHEPTGSIQKAVLEVTSRTRMRNILGLEAGIQMPLSPRFDLSLEGFYQRQWKKPSSIAPDFLGIQAGINWLF